MAVSKVLTCQCPHRNNFPISTKLLFSQLKEELMFWQVTELLWVHRMLQVEQDQLQVGIWLPCTGSRCGWGMSLRMAPPGAVPADGQNEEGLFPFGSVGISHVAASGATSAFLPVPEEPGSTFRTSWYWDVYQDVPLSCGWLTWRKEREPVRWLWLNDLWRGCG